MIPGEVRCRQCGTTYGDDNYCPRCHNTTGVQATADGYRCLACGAPRERKPGTLVVPEGSGALGMFGGRFARRGGALAMRVLGGLAMAGALLVGAGFAYVGGSIGLVLGAALGLVGVGVGALLFRGASKQSAAADAEERTRRELALVALAESRGGVLTVTDVSKAFGIGASEADAALTAMADGSRVAVEVTTDGRVQYVFRELAALGAPRVRVDLGDAPAGEPLEEEAPTETREDLERKAREP
jgi:hypothetical protein